MENEIRHYLNIVKQAMKEGDSEQFKPTYIVTAVKLPTGAIELAVNTSDIESKIDYILESYDENMALKTNSAIVMQNILIV